MIRVILCTECGKEGGLTLTLHWRYEHYYCNHCNQTKDETRTYRFCSDKCLLKFVKRFANHKHKWVEHGGATGLKMCAICFLLKWPHSLKSEKQKIKRRGYNEKLF